MKLSQFQSPYSTKLRMVWKNCKGEGGGEAKHSITCRRHFSCTCSNGWWKYWPLMYMIVHVHDNCVHKDTKTQRHKDTKC